MSGVLYLVSFRRLLKLRKFEARQTPFLICRGPVARRGCDKNQKGLTMGDSLAQDMVTWHVFCAPSGPHLGPPRPPGMEHVGYGELFAA